MQLDIPISAFTRVTDALRQLDADTLVVVCDILAELGLLVSPRADGGFDFETLLNRAKRLVIQELMKIKGVTTHEKAQTY